MGHDAISKASKQVSWLLRHGAPSEGITMDAAGWVAVGDVLRSLRISRAELDTVIRENNKSRIEVAGDRIRACQGHSLQGMPVTQDALEASWEPYQGGGSLWHGTHIAAATGIGREGILPGDRTHVHLAESLKSTVGKRANVDMMIEVSPDRLRDAGFPAWKSSNGVLLCRLVPPSCFVGLTLISPKAKTSGASLRKALGLPAEGHTNESERAEKAP